MVHTAAQVSSLADARAVLVRVQYRATDMARALAHGQTRYPFVPKGSVTFTSTVPSGPNGETETYPIKVSGTDAGVFDITISPW